jgi:ribosome-associated protein
MQAEQLGQFIVAKLDDLKAVNTVTLDVSDLTDMMDYLPPAGSGGRGRW